MFSYILPKIDDDKEELAWFVAKECHMGQMYGENDPYINHVKRVFDRVVAVSENREFRDVARVVAILHDTVEDSKLSIDEIGNLFRTRIRNAVWSITRNKEEESYFEYIERVRENPVSTLVKTCDLIENLTHCYMERGKYLDLIKRYEKALAILAAKDF